MRFGGALAVDQGRCELAIYRFGPIGWPKMYILRSRHETTTNGRRIYTGTSIPAIGTYRTYLA